MYLAIKENACARLLIRQEHRDMGLTPKAAGGHFMTHNDTHCLCASAPALGSSVIRRRVF